MRTEADICKKWQYNNPPMVSITCIAYNHEKYISQAIDSFLIQETDFPFEIIIHDDASTDNTQEIIKHYAKKYPNLIRTILQKENHWLGKGINATTTIVWPSAKGKYIAWCEGDDYWTDPLKLQKQVDFLEGHESYSGIHSKVAYIDKDNNHLGYSDRVQPNFESISFGELVQKNVIHTCSFLFKKESLLYGDKYLWEITPEFHDIYLFLGVALKGRIKYLNEHTATYRRFVGIMQTFTKESVLKASFNYLNFFINFSEISANQKSSALFRLAHVRLNYALFLAKQNRKAECWEEIKNFTKTYYQFLLSKKFLKIKLLKIKFRTISGVFMWYFFPRTTALFRDMYNKVYHVFNR